MDYTYAGFEFFLLTLPLEIKTSLVLENNSNFDQTPNQGRSGAGNSLLLNLLIIIIVAALGLWICYISIALFTKHGQKDTVPNVENLTYTEAIKKLHAAGFKIDIRDSLYREDVKPGLVIEQFPKPQSVVKPGRKIFLYINAVNPKQVVLDEGTNHSQDALKGVSLRQALSRLEELGFKKVQIIKVLGENDCIVKVLSNGRTVKKGDKVPINSKIIIEVYDGRLQLLRDSLQNIELQRSGNTYYYNLERGQEGYFDPNESSSESYPEENYSSGGSGGSYSSPQSNPEPSQPEENTSNEEENYEFKE